MDAVIEVKGGGVYERGEEEKVRVQVVMFDQGGGGGGGEGGLESVLVSAGTISRTCSIGRPL